MPPWRDAARAFLRGGLLRCPACGVGAIGDGWFSTRDACPACSAPFETGRGEFTGALMFGQGFFATVALFGWFVLAILVDAADWIAYAWAVTWAIAVPLAFYRNWKGLWIGAMHAFDPELAKLRLGARDDGRETRDEGGRRGYDEQRRR